ncbi:MAG: hypothetical protein J6X28_04575, partial [Bacilli bacterium]|nr:hypothetical protein [Bacilli bacterium]
LDVTPEELPENDQEFAFTFTMNDVQADENAHERKKYIDVEDLKAMAIPSGEGLSLSTVEENKYIYRGANPDNYIMLGEDMYRMISIEPDNTVKVIKTESVGTMSYDVGYKYQPEGITEGRHGDGNFCNYAIGNTGGRVGCSIWGSISTIYDANGNYGTWTTLPSQEAYLNVYLNGGNYYEHNLEGWHNTLPTATKNVIVTHNFNVGITQSGTLAQNIAGEKTYGWSGKVALISATDFVQANSNTEECYSVRNNSRIGGNVVCKENNWLAFDKSYYTITPVEYTPQRVYSNIAFDINQGYLNDYIVINRLDVFPSFYLTSTLKLTGEGTASNPYQLYQPSN